MLPLGGLPTNSMNTFQKTFIFLTLTLTLPSYSQASLSPEEEDNALKLSNNAIGKKIGDYSLTDQDSKVFKLKEFAGNKPIVISLIYTSCGHICPAITANLKNAIQEADKDFGTKFNAITIGFDVENDTPQRMKEYGGNFTKDFKNWRFATGDRETIDTLAKDLGFYYKKTDGGFDHLNAVSIVDAKGRIYKQVYGIDFKPEEILKPVNEAINPDTASTRIAENKTSGILDRIILFCYKYDKATGTYKLDYGMLMTMIMAPIFFISVTTVFIAYLFLSKDIKK